MNPLTMTQVELIGIREIIRESDDTGSLAAMILAELDATCAAHAETRKHLGKQGDECDQLVEQLAQEKETRIEYQDTVYAVCLELDKMLGNSPSKGQAVGSRKEEVLVALRRVLSRPCAKCQVQAIFNAVNDPAIQDEDSGALRAKQEVVRTFLDFASAQAEWSQATFGTDAERGPTGPLRHLVKEVQEALANIEDEMEYVDCFFLVLDASRRAKIPANRLLELSFEKLGINKARKWGKPTSDDPVEHDRTQEVVGTQNDELQSQLNGAIDDVNALADNQNAYSVEVFQLKQQLAEAEELRKAHVAAINESGALLERIMTEHRAQLAETRGIAGGLAEALKALNCPVCYASLREPFLEHCKGCKVARAALARAKAAGISPLPPDALPPADSVDEKAAPFSGEKL